MTDPSVFTIGTRGSPLALAQAHQTQGLLAGALGLDLAQVPLRIIRTTGDAIQDRPLSEAGAAAEQPLEVMDLFELVARSAGIEVGGHTHAPAAEVRP